MLLKLSRDVAPHKIYQMVYILMLLWRHARFQSPSSCETVIKIRLLNGKQLQLPFSGLFRHELQGRKLSVCKQT